jgi:hypothetical protein
VNRFRQPPPRKSVGASITRGVAARWRTGQVRRPHVTASPVSILLGGALCGPSPQLRKIDPDVRVPVSARRWVMVDAARSVPPASPRRPAAGGGHNLPADLTSFVGRNREVRELKTLLGAARLVTLTEIGGVGKSRVAPRAGFRARAVQRAGPGEATGGQGFLAPAGQLRPVHRRGRRSGRRPAGPLPRDTDARYFPDTLGSQRGAAEPVWHVREMGPNSRLRSSLTPVD